MGKKSRRRSGKADVASPAAVKSDGQAKVSSEACSVRPVINAEFNNEKVTSSPITDSKHHSYTCKDGQTISVPQKELSRLFKYWNKCSDQNYLRGSKLRALMPESMNHYINGRLCVTDIAALAASYYFESIEKCPIPVNIEGGGYLVSSIEHFLRCFIPTLANMRPELSGNADLLRAKATLCDAFFGAFHDHKKSFEEAVISKRVLEEFRIIMKQIGNDSLRQVTRELLLNAVSLSMMKFDSKFKERHDSIGRLEVSLGTALETVQKNLDQWHSVCWECNKGRCAKDGFFQACDRCGIARYCSEACQMRAWTSGHKKKCKKLPYLYQNVTDTLQLLENIHEHKTSYMDLRLNERREYTMLRTMHIGIEMKEKILCGFTKFMPPNLMSLIRGPSMEIFYENMRKIQKEGWWIFSDFQTKEKNVSYEQQVLNYMCNLLCYDYSAAFDAEPTGSLESKLRSVFGESGCFLSRDRFLEQYCNTLTTDDYSEQQWRNEKLYYKRIAMVDFIKEHHKQSDNTSKV